MARSPYEKKAHHELETEGFQVDYKARPFRVPPKYNVDFMGAFDLLAYKPGSLRFISIKGHAGVPADHRRDVGELRLPDGCIKEIWSYKADKTVKKEVIE